MESAEKTIKLRLFTVCHNAAKAYTSFDETEVHDINEPQTAEEARQYFRALYRFILLNDLEDEYDVWKSSLRDNSTPASEAAPV